MYDCYDTIAKNYKETHPLDDLIKKAFTLKQEQAQVPVEGKYHVPPTKVQPIKSDQKFIDEAETDDED